MPISQILMTAGSAGGGGGGGTPNSYAGYGSNPVEGGNTTVTVTVENWDGSRVYWTVVGKGSPAADPNTDMTGTLSGFWDPGVTSFAQTVVTTIGFVGSDGTEGTEYWGVDLGSSPGASDFYSSGDWPIEEPLDYTPWTIEWWHKSNPTQPSQFPRVFGISTYPNQEIGFSLEGVYYAWVNGSAINTGVNVVHNVWQHWVMVSGETTFSIYKDGTRVVTANRSTYGGLIDNTANDFYIGIDSSPSNGFKGLITNFRVVKGEAMYDPSQSTITVPSLPLTSNADTELLLKAASTGTVYTDSSIRGRTAWGIGSNAFSSDTPFTAAGPYTQFTNTSGQTGGGIYSLTFGGANYNADLLNVRTGWSVTNGVISGKVIGNPVEYSGLIDIQVDFAPSGTNNWTFTQPSLGGSIEMYTSSYGMIAYDNGTEWAFDLPSIVRLTSGTALGFNGTDNQYVVVEDNLADWNLGDNWTIEWWQKIPAGVDGFLSVLCQDANVPTYSGIDVFINNGNIQMFNAGRQMSEGLAPRDQWNHIALQNYGGTLTGYVNGVAQAFSGSHPGTISPSSPLNLVIGSRTADGGANFYGQYFNGQLANIRISNIARYTGTFIPPTTVVSGANTVLALDGSLGSSGMLVDEMSRHTLTNNSATIVTIV
jgi:hypothetical protein